MPGHNLFTGSYPVALKILAAVSIAWIVCAVGGGLYGFYVGVALSDLTPIVAASVLIGLVLLISATAWKWRIDSKPVMPQKAV